MRCPHGWLREAWRSSPAESLEPKRPTRIALGTLRSTDGQHVDLSAPQCGLTVLVFLLDGMSDLQCLQSDAGHAFQRFPRQEGEMGRHLRRSRPERRGCESPCPRLQPEVSGGARDRRGALVRKLGATMTPEAFVIDAEGQVRYHGRIDDQFVARRSATPIRPAAS